MSPQPSRDSRRRFLQQGTAAASALAFPLVGGAQPQPVFIIVDSSGSATSTIFDISATTTTVPNGDRCQSAEVLPTNMSLTMQTTTGFGNEYATTGSVARLDVEDVEELRVLFREDLFALDEDLVDGLAVGVQLELELMALEAPLNELLLRPRGLRFWRRRDRHRHQESEGRHQCVTLSRLWQTPTSELP
jgi:hypothetical protein